MATVVLDKSPRKATYSFATFLKNQGAAVFIDDRHAIAQNKIILIDRRVIIEGSFNFTSAAESKNAENLLVITGHPELYGDYSGVFNVPGGSRTFNLRLRRHLFENGQKPKNPLIFRHCTPFCGVRKPSRSLAIFRTETQYALDNPI